MFCRDRTHQADELAAARGFKYRQNPTLLQYRTILNNFALTYHKVESASNSLIVGAGRKSIAAELDFWNLSDLRDYLRPPWLAIAAFCEFIRRPCVKEIRRLR